MSDEPRDAHLLAALRHAPDRDAVPPPEVTARILDAARAAAKPSPPALLRWIGWLARPQVGAAFATLAVAVLVGVMWSSQEPPVPASVSPEAARDVGEAAARRADTPTAAVPAPPMAAPAPATASPPPAERRVAKPQADRPSPSRSSDRAPVAQNQESREGALPPAPTQPLAPTDATAAAQPAARQRAESSGAAQGGALAAKQAAAPPRLAESAASFDPLLALEAGGDAGWTWSASIGERAHGPAQRELWAAMRAATQGRWDAAPPMPPLAPWLQLRSGERRSVLWLRDGALYLTDADGRTWRAPVTPEQARDWQRSVARW